MENFQYFGNFLAHFSQPIKILCGHYLIFICNGCGRNANLEGMPAGRNANVEGMPIHISKSSKILKVVYGEFLVVHVTFIRVDYTICIAVDL